MELSWLALATIVLFAGIMDAYLYFLLRHNRRWIKNIHLGLSGIALVVIIWVYHTQNSLTNSFEPQNYRIIEVSLLTLFSLKLIYVVWRSVQNRLHRVWKKMPASRHWYERLHKPHYPILTRRKIMSQIGIIMASAPLFSLIMGWAKGRFNFQIRHQKLSFPNLPESFEGLRIVQISDLHLGSFNSSHKELREAFHMIQSENPDLICFTGDLVNNFARETEGFEEVFSILHAPLGKYSILGNHDYGKYSRWSSKKAERKNATGIIQAHSKLGFTLLRNEAVTLERNGETIALAGVENWGLPPFPQYADLKKATNAWDANIPFAILLTHDPNHWEAEVIDQTPYDLTLAGHTHGMQLGLEHKGMQWSPARYKFKRWAGLHQINNQFLYINRGLGVMGLPARIGMPPEITLLELTRESIDSSSI